MVVSVMMRVDWSAVVEGEMVDWGVRCEKMIEGCEHSGRHP